MEQKYLPNMKTPCFLSYTATPNCINFHLLTFNLIPINMSYFWLFLNQMYTKMLSIILMFVKVKTINIRSSLIRHHKLSESSIYVTQHPVSAYLYSSHVVKMCVLFSICKVGLSFRCLAKFLYDTEKKTILKFLRHNLYLFLKDILYKRWFFYNKCMNFHILLLEMHLMAVASNCFLF